MWQQELATPAATAGGAQTTEQRSTLLISMESIDLTNLRFSPFPLLLVLFGSTKQHRFGVFVPLDSDILG